MFGIDLAQASTWKGLISLIISIGLFTLTPAQLELASAAGAAVYAFLSVIIKDKFGKTIS